MTKQKNWQRMLMTPFALVALTMLLLSGQGCATSSKVVGKAYVDENGYYCLHPDTLKTVNVVIKNKPKSRVVVFPL